MLPSWWTLLMGSLVFGVIVFLWGRRMFGVIDKRLVAATEKGKVDALYREGCEAFESQSYDIARSRLERARDGYLCLADFESSVELTILLARVSRAEGNDSGGIDILRKSLSALPPEAGEPLRNQLFAELGALMSEPGAIPGSPLA